jgi:5-methylcytosine-specific restriction protein B
VYQVSQSASDANWKKKDVSLKKVPIRISHNLSDRPILKEELHDVKYLNELNVGIQGTNFYATSKQYDYFLKNAKSKLEVSYWCYNTADEEHTQQILSGGFLDLPLDSIGNLQAYDFESKDLDRLESELEFIHGSLHQDEISVSTADIECFANLVRRNDGVLLIERGSRIRAFGVAKSGYQHRNEGKTNRHRVEVEWHIVGSYLVPLGWSEGRSIFETEVDNALYLIDLLKGSQEGTAYSNDNSKATKFAHPLNTIFYGPPGTGKTYHTLKRAAEIVSGKAIDGYDEARRIYREYLHDQIEFVTFHQNYGYEDFVQGLRPDTENNGVLSFHKKDGIFKSIADKARRNEEASKKGSSAREDFETAFERFTRPLVVDDLNEIEVKMERSSFFVTGISERSIYFRNSRGNSPHSLSINTLRDFYYHTESSRLIQGLSVYYRSLVNAIRQKGDTLSSQPEPLRNYVLIIDEINRANISRVFGELITLIEDDKRTQGEHPMKVRLPSGDVFSVPSNLYIIGTMNTADKSIALLDIALRRRFVFEAMYPRTEIPGQVIHDAHILRSINEQIVKKKNHDFQIGHAYFMGSDYKRADRMNNKVIPLLLEYFMNDGDTVKDILKVAGLSVKTDMWPLQVEE